ncbi:MAG: hypothetical protein DGJ47_000594 [Rickettsiaceae bacterium]
MYQCLSDREIILLSGQDSIKFINGISTNKIEAGKLIYTYFLNHQGRYLYDCFLFCNDTNELYLDINSKISEEFISYITKRKLRNDFNIKNVSGEYNILYTKTDAKCESLFNAQDPRSKLLGSRLYVDTKNINQFDITDEELLQKDKYEYGIIDGYSDMISEKSIPIEYEAEQQNALSFAKGCYVGQEVISRAKYQGVVRKGIFVLECDSSENISQNDAVLNLQKEKIGVVCSVYKNKLIALLRSEKVKLLDDNSVLINETRFVIKNHN